LLGANSGSNTSGVLTVTSSGGMIAQISFSGNSTTSTVEGLVDAGLVGFDRREAVTIPAVPDVAAWEAQARGFLASGFGNSKPAARYLA
jgi:hypothetical protein